MTEPRAIGTPRTPEELVEMLAGRKDALELSNAAIDEYWGFADGMTDKYLGPTRVKTVSLNRLYDFLTVLGLNLVLAESPDAMARLAERVEGRKPGYAHFSATRVSKAAIAKAIPRIFGEMGTKSWQKRSAHLTVWCASKIGRKGGKATAKKLTREQRSASARKAAIARWRKAKQRAKAMHACPLAAHECLKTSPPRE